MELKMMDRENFHQSLHILQIVRTAASIMASLLVTVAIIAIWRRHVGAFQTPLSGTMFLCVGLIFIGPTLVIRHWWRLITSRHKIPAVEVAWTLCTPSVSLLAILVAISVPGTSLVGVALLGLFFIAGEATLYRPRNRSVSAETTLGTLDYCELETGLAQLDAVSDSGCDGNASFTVNPNRQPEAGVSQQLTRCRTEDGLDCLKGWLRVDIPAGRRAQSVHLAFCPAFKQPPKIEVQTEEDAPANRIKTVQCLPYGAHLEIKLPRPTPTDETLTLRFQAVDGI